MKLRRDVSNEKEPILITPHPSPLRLAFHAVCFGNRQFSGNECWNWRKGEVNKLVSVKVRKVLEYYIINLRIHYWSSVLTEKSERRIQWRVSQPTRLRKSRVVGFPSSLISARDLLDALERPDAVFRPVFFWIVSPLAISYSKGEKGQFYFLNSDLFEVFYNSSLIEL